MDVLVFVVVAVLVGVLVWDTGVGEGAVVIDMVGEGEGE